MTKDAPAFDFYPERWLSGGAMFSDAEQISFLRLLCHQWIMEGLPDEVATLRRLGGKGVTGALLAKFPVGADGRRRNARLETIRSEQRARIASKRLGGALTNAQRYGLDSLGAGDRELVLRSVKGQKLYAKAAAALAVREAEATSSASATSSSSASATSSASVSAGGEVASDAGARSLAGRHLSPPTTHPDTAVAVSPLYPPGGGGSGLVPVGVVSALGREAEVAPADAASAAAAVGAEGLALQVESLSAPVPLDPVRARVAGWFQRRPHTLWSARELRAWRAVVAGGVVGEDLALLEGYYTAVIPVRDDFRRRDLRTLLNNWRGELDRARRYHSQHAAAAAADERAF